MLRRRPVGTVGVMVAVLALVAAGAVQTVRWTSWASFEHRAFATETARHEGSARTVTWTFPYRGEQRSVRVRVADAYLDAARRLGTAEVFRYDGPIQAAYVSTLVKAEAGGPFVSDLASELRRLKVRLGLDGDEYVEMLARAVQSIPYGTPEPRIGLPVEVLEDGRGVCTDKSVLLASLLLHEGYGTAVWAFESQRHVAVGVKGDAGGFRGSGYAFVETTLPSYVNEVSGAYLGVSGTGHAPQLIIIGGERVYTADAESRYVAERLDALREFGRQTRPYAAYAAAADERWRPLYAGLAGRGETAGELARWIEANSDYRAAVHRALTRSGGER
ncbi:MAG TPA: hypothetical protein VF902_01030 [Coriobacteriia bacterium]